MVGCHGSAPIACPTLATATVTPVATASVTGSVALLMPARPTALAGLAFVAAIVWLIEDIVATLLRLFALDRIAHRPLLVGTLPQWLLLLNTLPFLWSPLDP